MSPTLPGAGNVARGRGTVSRRTLLQAVPAVMLPLAVDPVRAQPATPAASPLPDVRRGGALTIGAIHGISSLDPLTSRLSSGDAIAYELLYDALVAVTATGDIVPALATSWAIATDGLTYTFVLRPDVVFHDSTPCDAAAVVANLDRYRAEGSPFPYAHRLAALDTVTVVDATTFTLTLARPSAPLLAALSRMPIVAPAAMWATDPASSGIGSGPFRLRAWEPEGTLDMVRCERYRIVGDDGSPLPYLDAVTIVGEADDAVRLERLRAGTIDVDERADLSTSGTPDVETDLMEQPYTSATTYMVILNATTAPFDNSALRQAVSAALDRQAIIDAIGGGTGYVAPMPFPRDTWFFVEHPSPAPDRDLARTMLQEAGLPDGIDCRLCIIDRPVERAIAELVTAQLAIVGIRTTIVVLPRRSWVDLWEERQGEMGINQRSATAIDPDDQSALFQADNLANFAGYDSARVRELIDAANATTDRSRRRALWQEITTIVVEDAVYIGIGSVPATAAWRREIEGIRLAGGQTIDATAAHRG